MYEEEKPYSLRFTAPDGFPRANIKLDRHDLHIHDIRSKKAGLSLEKDGCFVWNLHSRMRYDDFSDEAKVREVYLTEVADGLRARLGADRVQIFEHTVGSHSKARCSTSFYLLYIAQIRKRHNKFPISTGEPYDYNQPTSIAHVGECSKIMLRGSH